MGKIWVLETMWLLAVDSLFEGAVKKSIRDIQLMNKPSRRDSKGQNDSNRAGLDNR